MMSPLDSGCVGRTCNCHVEEEKAQGVIDAQIASDLQTKSGNLGLLIIFSPLAKWECRHRTLCGLLKPMWR